MIAHGPIKARTNAAYPSTSKAASRKARNAGQALSIIWHGYARTNGPAQASAGNCRCRTRASNMTKATTRRYSIEVKDMETGATVILTVEWTAARKGMGLALISRLSGVQGIERNLGPDECEPARGKSRYN